MKSWVPMCRRTDRGEVCGLSPVPIRAVDSPIFRQMSTFTVSGAQAVAKTVMPEPLQKPARPRVLLVYGVITLITIGSLFDIVTGREHWPFSPYPMYATVTRERSLTVLRLYGVTKEAPAREMPLVALRYIQPFTSARLEGALRTIKARRGRQPLKAALSDCLRRYEKLRRAGRHEGPPLQGIRLYRVYWKLDPWARNVDCPNRKELILEAGTPRREGGRP
jgi:hypothetical protein